MVTIMIPLLISTLLGFLAGMGVGGGSLLLLWLTQVVGLEQTQARILNLLFFLPAAFVATIFRRKEQSASKSVVIPGIIAGCASAVIFSLLSKALDIALMKKLLGGLLILTGAREIFHRPRKAK